ncbi:MAG: biotin-dependent carboxyltransferase family protein [Acidobacteria bacterium]|nr:biotin-dependent carboxyltransferase family protein [Acidobacteriota bacterium]
MSLVVVRAVGLVSVQDLGRPGHMHDGLAPGGALVPELLIAANRHARNPDASAAIEVMGALTVRADAAVMVATDSTSLRQLRPGEELTVASDRRRVAYLAVRGGVDAPVVLGSRSVQLSAGLGQVLRAGTLLAAGDAPIFVRPVGRFVEGDQIRVLPGPDLGAFAPGALEVLTSTTWTISAASDRVGTRLGGASLTRTGAAEVTRPMVRGAIEVPRDGQPIVLGPEHPTTGGYPVIGVIASEDLGRFFATGVGRQVRFIVAPSAAGTASSRRDQPHDQPG